MSGYRDLRSTDLQALVSETARRLTEPARLYLLGQTSHLAEGWRAEVERFDLAGEHTGEAGALRDAALSAAAHLGMATTWEHPGDVIPLPRGHATRIRETGIAWPGSEGRVAVAHFDPYSVVFRAVARGDEPDYRVALAYLEHGWVEFALLERLLTDTVTRFTSATIQQDPAEFRRKFRGLRQMWLASPAGRT